MRLLLADDERDLANAVTAILKHSGYDVDTVYDGGDALRYSSTGNYDCIIMDIMMPKLSGLEALKHMRSRGVRTPVILLTAKSELEDRLTGLNSGADDYITKPFETEELLARINAILRRQNSYAPDTAEFNGLILNKAKYELSYEGMSVTLGNKEFRLMELFISRPRHVISANYMMDRIWGWDSDAEINVVWVYISHLRKKLQELGAPAEIRAKRGVGYSLEEKQVRNKPDDLF